MCTLFLFINQIKNCPIALVSNRDEYKSRKSTSIQGWDHNLQLFGNEIIAPRDEFKRGTWFACQNKIKPKWAILTNIRDLNSFKDNLKSRGDIILNFLNSNDSAENYLKKLEKVANEYNYFNLIFSDHKSIYYFHSKDYESNKLYDYGDNGKNIFALSNGKINSNWPKISYSREKFQAFLTTNNENNFNFYWDYFKNEMMNSKTYDISTLPNTGLSPEREILLSSLFIPGEQYGTNSSLFFGIEKNDSLFFYEQTYDIFSQVDTSKKININFYPDE